MAGLLYAGKKLSEGKLGGIGMVSPLLGVINSRQKKKRQAAAGAAGSLVCWPSLLATSPCC